MPPDGVPRDTFALRRDGARGGIERVPAVTLGDPTYTGRLAVALVDDDERRALRRAAELAVGWRAVTRLVAAAFLAACAAGGATAGILTALHR